MMNLVKTVDGVRNAISRMKKDGMSLGFVPTMGYLHKGHMSLIERAKRENDIVVVSVFVNPTQFAPHEDFDTYPRDVQRDFEIAVKSGADIVFAPETGQMYDPKSSTFVVMEGGIDKKLCGKSRPTFFKGVTTVVSKLFNIVEPDKAYFGQKDAQQVCIIQKMVREMNYKVDIVPCELVREEDGLALSSRNVYLSEEERRQALILSKSLFQAKKMFEEGERSVKKIRDFMLSNIGTMDLARIDYVDIVDAKNLEEIETVDSKTLIALAVSFGNTRLIDNIMIGGEK